MAMRPLSVQRWMVSALAGACFASTAGAQLAHEPGEPHRNVLLIVSEDNGPDLGCYGDRFARTPNLDRLAAEGVRFDRAYITASVCSPSRASLLTGLYPHQNGQMGLATHKHRMYRHWPNLVSVLKECGYRTGAIGKIHVNPEDAFPFDWRAFPGSNFNKRPMQAFAQRAREFMGGGDQPFFLMVNFPDAHFPLLRQQNGLPEQPRRADDVAPMPWLGVDSARLRTFVADYYNCLERLDTGVGLLLEALDELELTDETIIIYLSDHGPQFSRGKTSAYEPGVRVPLIMRLPEASTTGLVRGELVSSVDVFPTVLDLLGLDALPALPGRSLAPLLRGREDESPRQYMVMLGIGGAPVIYYLQYGIRDQRYKLILNPIRDRSNTNAVAYLNHHNAFFGAGSEQAEIDAAESAVQAAYARYRDPPRVELYDLARDPHEWHNLADDPDHAAVKDRLLAALRAWQAEMRDPLGDPELLGEYTAIQDQVRNLPYRKDPGFRWPYLDQFEHYVYPPDGAEGETLDRQP